MQTPNVNTHDHRFKYLTRIVYDFGRGQIEEHYEWFFAADRGEALAEAEARYSIDEQYSPDDYAEVIAEGIEPYYFWEVGLWLGYLPRRFGHDLQPKETDTFCLARTMEEAQEKVKDIRYFGQRFRQGEELYQKTGRAMYRCEVTYARLDPLFELEEVA